MMKYKFYFILVTMAAIAFTAFMTTEPAGAQSSGSPQPVATPTPSPTPEIEEVEEVIRVDSETVNILFTAQDRNRRLLLGLKQEDIEIYENGIKQEVAAFGKQIDLPMSLAILIDTSVSQERTLPQEKAAAISFLDSVIRPSKDEVSVISFTGESTLEQGMTNNMSRLRNAIERVRFSAPAGYIGGGVIAGTPPISGTNAQVQGSTAIWDSVWVSSEEILGPAPEKTRRAIILLSDGINTYGKKKLDDAVQAAQRAEAVIYSIGIGDNFYGGVDEGALKKISERTGGRAYFPRDEGELRAAFAQIQEEMRSQYLIAYEPSNQAQDGSYRTVEIKVINRDLQKQKVQLTHRKGYFAKNANK